MLKYSAGGPRSRGVTDIETVLANRVVRRIRNLNLLLRLLRRTTGMPPPRAARTGRREGESSAQKSPAEICRAIDQTGEQEAIGSNACGGCERDGDQKCRLRVPAPHLTPKDTGGRLCRSPPSITVKGNYAHFSLYNVRTRREVSVSVAAPSMRKLNIR